jgi:hypothetical protein
MHEKSDETPRHGVFTPEGGESSTTSTLSQIDKDPVKYYYSQGRQAELALRFLYAAEMYIAAYVEAKKAGRSSAIFHKWASMRCIEYDAIYDRLKKQQYALGKTGRVLKDGSIMALDVWASDVIDKDILRRYKERLSASFHYNIVIWNPTTKIMKYVYARNFYIASEPDIERTCSVNEHGNSVKEEGSFSDAEMILHKWMMTTATLHNTQERNMQIRRSIRIEFLHLPKFMCVSEFPKKKFWETYVEPAIGNRNIGELEKQYSDHLINLVSAQNNTGYDYYGEY